MMKTFANSEPTFPTFGRPTIPMFKLVPTLPKAVFLLSDIFYLGFKLFCELDHHTVMRHPTRYKWEELRVFWRLEDLATICCVAAVQRKLVCRHG